MLWTQEAVEALRRLALEGRSATVIAAALGAASRNAVIGKANRIGVKLNGGGAGSPAERIGTGAERPRGRPRAASSTALVPRKQPLAPALPRERKPAWIFADAEVGEMLRVGLEDVREANCRWPLGDPADEDFAYCGLPPAEGHSYCAGHCRMAYRPPGAAREAPRQWRWQRDRGSPLRLP